MADNFTNLIDLMNKEFGKNTIFKPKDELPVYEVQRMSTGNLQLDIDLGGGLAIGRIHLITGPFSSGKTYLFNKVASQFTARGERVALVDEEHTFDPDWMEDCGVDMDLLYVARSKNAEQTVDMVELLVASGEFGLVGLDSIAAMIPKTIKDDSAEKAHMGVEARLNNRMFKKIVSQQTELKMANKVPTTVIVINQIREKIGVMFGSPETLPGGNGQLFYPSTWIDFRAKETILDGSDNTVGMYFNYNIKKNKTAPPRKKGTLSMFNADYMGMSAGSWDYLGAIIDVATKTGVIAKEGKFYNSDSTGTGILSKKYMYKQLWKELLDDSDLQLKMVEHIQTHIPDIRLSYIVR